MREATVVTGAASGIGRAIAERLTADGTSVVAVDRTDVVGQAHLAAVRGDVRDAALHDEVLARVDALGVTLTGWVNAAGITRVQALTAATPGFVDELVAVNQLGTYWGCAAAVKTFVSRDVPGSIVNISSVHGAFAHPGHSVYEMTKAAVEALTRSIAVEYADYGIRANAVAPGAVDTPALRRSAGTADASRRIGHLVAQAPLGRLAAASEIAAVVNFLLSTDAAFISGQTIRVDGAWTSRLVRDLSGEQQ